MVYELPDLVHYRGFLDGMHRDSFAPKPAPEKSPLNALFSFFRLGITRTEKRHRYAVKAQSSLRPHMSVPKVVSIQKKNRQ